MVPHFPQYHSKFLKLIPNSLPNLVIPRSLAPTLLIPIPNIMLYPLSHLLILVVLFTYLAQCFTLLFPLPFYQATSWSSFILKLWCYPWLQPTWVQFFSYLLPEHQVFPLITTCHSYPYPQEALRTQGMWLFCWSCIPSI